MARVVLVAALAAITLAASSHAGDADPRKTPERYWLAVAFPTGFDGPEIQVGTETSLARCERRARNFIAGYRRSGAPVNKDARVNCVNRCHLDGAFVYFCDTVAKYKVRVREDGSVVLEKDSTDIAESGVTSRGENS